MQVTSNDRSDKIRTWNFNQVPQYCLNKDTDDRIVSTITGDSSIMTYADVWKEVHYKN